MVSRLGKGVGDSIQMLAEHHAFRIASGGAKGAKSRAWLGLLVTRIEVLRKEGRHTEAPD